VIHLDSLLSDCFVLRSLCSNNNLLLCLPRVYRNHAFGLPSPECHRPYPLSLAEIGIDKKSQWSWSFPTLGGYSGHTELGPRFCELVFFLVFIGDMFALLRDILVSLQINSDGFSCPTGTRLRAFPFFPLAKQQPLPVAAYPSTSRRERGCSVYSMFTFSRKMTRTRTPASANPGVLDPFPSLAVHKLFPPVSA